MVAKSIQATGKYQDIGIIRLENGAHLEWLLFSGREVPRLPFGTRIKISVTFEEPDFLNGVNGIVWAAYDHRQTEIIQNALLVQNIFSEAQKLVLDEWLLHLLVVPNTEDVPKAIDFIWRDESGMRLQPDWWYPADAQNESFKKWIDGR